MPRLVATQYRLFQGEESSVLAAEQNNAHDFGGELVLTLEGGDQVFVSWVNEPVQHSIGIKDSSHFVAEAGLICYDVSHSKMWSKLVGSDINFKFIAANNQILEISSATDHVLACSFERGHWWADEVMICKEAPPLDHA
ncbi:MAG: hypothetical protein LCH70_02985 [Proteobacteria bacterium]|nr:hypothetical protein [Pseudomonadota bacterium]